MSCKCRVNVNKSGGNITPIEDLLVTPVFCITCIHVISTYYRKYSLH